MALAPPGPQGPGYEVVCFQAEQIMLLGSYAQWHYLLVWSGLKDGGYSCIVWEEVCQRVRYP